MNKVATVYTPMVRIRLEADNEADLRATIEAAKAFHGELLAIERTYAPRADRHRPTWRAYGVVTYPVPIQEKAA